MKVIIPMAIGAGVVFAGTAIALFSVGVATAAVTERILEEIFD